MKISATPVLFAGRTEYLRDLQTFRKRIGPLYPELEQRMKLGQLQNAMESSERALEKATRRAETEKSLKARMAWGIAKTASLYNRGRTLGTLLIMAFKGEDLDGKELLRAEARDPQKAERMKREAAERASQLAELRGVVEQLRQEPASESEKQQWLYEFEEQTHQSLDAVEHYTLKEWNG